MEDLIERRAALDAICKEWCGCDYKHCVHTERHFDGCDDADIIASLPPVTPHKWIPVTERVPEDRGYYLVTILAENGYHRSREVIYFGDDFKWSTTRDVIAWMPLLEPFKAESEDEG